MKKTLSILIALIFLIGALTSTTLASSESESEKAKEKEKVIFEDEEITFEDEEITDEEVLKERADEGIIEGPAIKATPSLSGDTEITENGEKFKVKLSSAKYTVQKLKSVKTKDGKQTDSYVATVFVKSAVEPLETEVEKDSDGFQLYGSIDDEVWDDMQGAVLWMKWYYTHYSDDSEYDMYEITKTEASITKEDSSYALIKLYMNQYERAPCYSSKYHSAASYLGSLTHAPTKTVTSPTSGTVYTLNDGETNRWWNAAGSVSKVSAYSSATLKRAGTQWDIELPFEFGG